MTLGYTDADVNSVVDPTWGDLTYAVTGDMASYFGTAYVGETDLYVGGGEVGNLG